MKQSSQVNENTGSNIGKKVDEAIDTSKKYFDEVSNNYGQKLKEGCDVAKEKAQMAGTEINAWVQRKPLMALGVALGAGLLLGRAFSSIGSSSSDRD